MQKKQTHDPNWLSKQVEKTLAARGVFVAARWSVEEYVPEYEDEYGRDVSARFVDRSPFFDTEREFQEFLDTVEPNKGNVFKIVYEECYEKTETTRTWYIGRLPRE
jgi:hypothetical protein